MEKKELKKLREAEKKRHEEFKKTHPAPKEKNKEKKFKEAVQNLPDEEWSDFDIGEELSKKRDLRKVIKTIARNQPLMKREIREKLEWTDKKKSHCDDMIDLLKEMKLVEEIKVMNIWAKDYCNREFKTKIPISKEEKNILSKFNFWSKTIKKQVRDKYLGVSGYWKLTEKGKMCVYGLGK